MLRLSNFSALALLFASSLLAAEAPAFSGSIRSRAEHWKWFETPAAEDEYVFLGTLIRAGVTHRWTSALDAQLELAAPILVGLPEDAVAPPPQGQLGFGGTYAAANGQNSSAASLFVKQAWVRYGSQRLGVRAGRFELVDGVESMPGDATLAAVKRTRVVHRLIGNFGFSHVGRSFDGLQLTATPAPGWNVNTVIAHPTRGAFSVKGNDSLRDVTLTYGALTRSREMSDIRIFAVGYADDRDTVETDNRPAAVRAADRGKIELATLGGHYLRGVPLRQGKIDVLLYGLIQSGDWGALEHEAWAWAAESGWTRGAFGVRAGVFNSSGDDDPDDGQHGTFFQVLPTPRVYARMPFYNAMNSRDLFVAGSWKSGRWTLSSEVHGLRLSSARDLWYSGGGAYDKSAFGFAGRPSSSQNDLATVVDLAAELTLGPKTSVNAYAAYARGGAVVDSIFEGDSARLLFVEVTRRF
jgi:hypothetical protein